MKPILYDSNETEFLSNGIGRLDCTRCEVTEQLNGSYELEFDITKDALLFYETYEDRIIGAIHDDESDLQPFDIYASTETIDGKKTFYARHIGYRLGKNVVMPFNAHNCTDALNGLNTHAVTPTGFNFWTDVTHVTDFNVYNPVSIRAAIGGMDYSILDLYGGELEWDKWTVKLHKARGSDKGVAIQYGVNMLDYSRRTDGGGSFNAVTPFWRSQDNFVSYDDGYVALPDTPTGELKIIPLDCSSLFEDAPSQQDLWNAGNYYVAMNASGIGESIEVDFVALWQTLDPPAFAWYQRLRLGDTVSIIINNREYKSKIVSVTYDVLAERYTKMTLGEIEASFIDVIRTDISQKSSGDDLLNYWAKTELRAITNAEIDSLVTA